MSIENQLIPVDGDRLFEEAIPAALEFGSGDSARAKSLIRNGKLPDELKKAAEQLLDGRLSPKVFDDSVGALTSDPIKIRKILTRDVLNRSLFAVCATMEDAISLNRGPAATYLLRHSPWYRDMVSLSNEFAWELPPFPLPIGGDARLLTKQHVATVQRNVGTVIAKGAESTADLYRLQRLLQGVMQSSSKMLAMWIR